mmetsp:Transcript_45075/g.130147  ORF Transcript_45075/g.130147 Transcript_45075/m.130147 type:complete len:1067 (+) Transcript_45075:30-3230(+)
MQQSAPPQRPKPKLMRTRTNFNGEELLTAPEQLEGDCRRLLDEVWHLDSLEEVEKRTQSMLREVDSAGRVMRQAAEKAQLLGNDLRHASDRLLVERAEGLKVFSQADLVRAAHAHQRLSQPMNREDMPWPLWSTGVNDLKTYGPGVRLYFQFVTTFTAVSFLCSLLTLPFVFICWRGHRLQSLPGIETHLSGTNALAYTTIGNLDAMNLTFMCDDLDTATVTRAFGWCDAVSVLIIYAVARWFELIVIPLALKDEKAKVMTPDDFTIFVSDLPRYLQTKEEHQHYEAELATHFENLMSASVTVDSAKLGQRVVSVDSLEDETECMRPGSGQQGQRAPTKFGRIVKIDRKHERVLVKWSGDSTTTPHDISGRRRTLLDAGLLSRLRNAGISVPTGDEDDESAVYRVCLVRDFSGELETIAKKKQKHHNNAYAKFARLQSADLKKRFAEMHDEALERLMCKPVRHRAVVGAFVVFRYIRYRNFILDGEYRFSGLIGRAWTQPAYLQFCRRSIRVQEAPVPSDIYWENLDYTFMGRALRGSVIWMVCAFSLIVFFVLLCMTERESHTALGGAARACLGEIGAASQDCECTLAGYSKIASDRSTGGLYERCQAWLQTQAQAHAFAMGASGVAAGINLFSGWLVRRMSFYRKPQSFTELNLFRLKAIFVMKAMCLGVITVIVHAKLTNTLRPFAGFFRLIGTGRFDDFSPEWFAIVGAQVITPFIFSSLIPILHALAGPLWMLKMAVLTNHRKTWPDIKRLWTPKDFPLALFQAESASAVFATLLFVGGMPILMLLLSLRLVITYWCDKYFLLRASSIPKRFTAHVTKIALSYVRLGCFLHTLIAIMIFGNPEIVGAPQDPSEQSLGGFGTLMIRWHREASLPNTLLFWVITIDHLIRLFIFVVGKPLVKAMMRWWCPEHAMFKFRPEVMKDVIFHEPFDARPMKEMERMKVDYNYEMTQHPNFKFLVTKEDVALAEQEKKPLDVGTEKTTISDSEDDGLASGTAQIVKSGSAVPRTRSVGRTSGSLKSQKKPAARTSKPAKRAASTDPSAKQPQKDDKAPAKKAGGISAE